MATSCAGKTASAVAKTAISRFAGKPTFALRTTGSPLGFVSPPPPAVPSRPSLRRLVTSSRLPVELGCAASLMPLHSVTASALYTSLLSLHSNNWGCLSEGFASSL